jgi:MoaA/NifB/PqqE/SkfB family radical SAM enzyme
MNTRDIQVLHIEPTDVCQAACPACSREINLTFDKTQQHHLKIQQIQSHFTDEQISQLDKMFMCGVYGDPAAGKDTLKIYQYFRSINPHITLGMNTNGAIRNKDWWVQLGSIFQQEKDYVVFSIDGLKDTNHLYRRGVDWDKMLENIETFIKTGAKAHWDMLVYRHNEHQVDECERFARKIGFSWFRVKVSKRQVPEGFAYPLHWQRTNIISRKISCLALSEKSAYIDAKGRLFPCCWLGSAGEYPIDFPQIQTGWQSNKANKTCVSTCGQTQQQNNFNSQWQKEVDLSV